MPRFYLRYPGGKEKALTLSYDDGVYQDIQLISILKKYGLKATFNINTGLFATEEERKNGGWRMTKEECLGLYTANGMEVASHTLKHTFIDRLPKKVQLHEIYEDVSNLEKDFHVRVVGGAYPYGVFDDSVVGLLSDCGIKYYRTVISNHGFELPHDWLRLPATCHHNDKELMNLAKKFVELKNISAPKMFYLWGHSYEFERDNSWNIIEEFAKYISLDDSIWFATNGEICEYVLDFDKLEVSLDGRRVYNPTYHSIWISIDGETKEIRSGETIEILS